MCRFMLTYSFVVLICCFHCFGNAKKVKLNRQKSSYDFTVKPLWISEPRVSEDTSHIDFSKYSINILSMVPYHYRPSRSGIFFKDSSSWIFEPTIKAGFKKVSYSTVRYQLHDQDIGCNVVSGLSNRPLVESRKEFSYNFDWVWHQIKECAWYYMKPPMGKEALPTELNLVIIFHEDIPHYLNDYMYVRLSDRLPWQTYGKDLPSDFDKHGANLIVVTTQTEAGKWLTFMNKFQIKTRYVLDMHMDVRHKLVDTIKYAIAQRIADKSQPNTDYLPYYMSMKYGNINYDYVQHPVSFVFMLPGFIPADQSKIFLDGFVFYEEWAAIIASLTGRYNAYFSAITYGNGEICPDCCDYTPLERYTKSTARYDFPHPYNTKGLHKMKPISTYKYKNFHYCMVHMLRDIPGDVSPQLVIIMVDYLEPFYLEPTTKVHCAEIAGRHCKSLDYLAMFAHDINSYYGHVHHIVAKYVSKPDGKPVGRLAHFYASHSHSHKVIGSYGTFGDLVISIPPAIDEKILTRQKMIAESEALQKADIVKSKSLLNVDGLNLLITVSRGINPIYVPGISQFVAHNYSEFKNILEPLLDGSKISVGFVEHYSRFDEEAANESKCRILSPLTNKCFDPVGNVLVKLLDGDFERPHDNGYLKQHVECINDKAIWPNPDGRLNLIVTLTTVNPADTFKFIMKPEQLSQAESTAAWDTFFNAQVSGFHSRIVMYPSRETIFSKLGNVVAHHNFNPEFGFVNTMATIVHEVAKDQICAGNPDDNLCQ